MAGAGDKSGEFVFAKHGFAAGGSHADLLQKP
jgi:hypothetical protein